MATLAKLVVLVIALLAGFLLSVRLRTVEKSDGRGNKWTETFWRLSPAGTAASLVLLLFSFAMMPAFGYIPVGHRGIVVGPQGVVMTVDDQGVSSGRVLGEGFYFLTPFLYQVEVLSVRTEAYKTDAEAASSDLQDVKATIVINYRLDPSNVWKVYQRLGPNYLDKVFSPAVQEAVKASTAKFNAEDLVQKRPLVATEIRRVLEERGAIFGFDVQAVSIVNFAFSEGFNKAVEEKAKATQEAQTARRIKEKIRAEQESKILEYQADATKRKLDLEAQAAGQKAQLLYISPQLIELRRVEAMLEMAKAWDGKLPVWMSGSQQGFLFQLPISPPTQSTSDPTRTK